MPALENLSPSHIGLIRKYRDDPVLFVQDFLKADPEVWQAEELRGVMEHDRVAIRSGHGVGKTAFLAWMIIWWLLFRKPALVAITAPSSTQMFDVLYPELSRWMRQLPDGFRDLFELKSDKMVLKEAPDLNFATFRTARKEQPEAFQGFHSKNMLFLIDEASGVDDIIFQVGEGSMSTKGAKTVMCGNPTRTSGYFYDAFHRLREVWRTRRVACMDSTQVNPRYAEEMALKWGADSNVYRVRVLGEFPASEDDVVIPLYLVESAIGRDVEPVGGPIIWGLDVARFGDDLTALAKRQGNVLLEPCKTWKGKDLMQTVGLLMLEYEKAQDKPTVIYVDSIGLGAGVVDRAQELSLPVVGVNVAESASVGDSYLRLRDELWFTVRDWLNAKDCLLAKDEALLGELTGPKWAPTSSGKVKVESKEQMKKRGVQSPNRADAFCLTFTGGMRFFEVPSYQLEPEVYAD